MNEESNMIGMTKLVLGAACLIALGGCQSGGTKAAAAEENCKPAVEGAVADAGMINANCPVMPVDDARGSGVAVAYTGEVAEWQGKKVAFCCDGCTHRWEKMTPAQRDEAIRKVAAK
jgi:hypothetical protein